MVTVTQLESVTTAGTTDLQVAYLWNHDDSADLEPSGLYQDGWSGLSWLVEQFGTRTNAIGLTHPSPVCPRSRCGSAVATAPARQSICGAR